jgi:poly-gamma-glutamate synthesis protein (capsule biosynthesis protein)
MRKNAASPTAARHYRALRAAGFVTMVSTVIILAALFVGDAPSPVFPTIVPHYPPPPPLPAAVVRLMAVGDNLIHNSIYQQAQARAQGRGYDFRYAYDMVRGALAQADLAAINQESPVAGAIAPPSSYPMFNSPTQLGDEVYKLGFRYVNLSNNHMLDKGARGVRASLDYWAQKPGVVTSGAYKDETDFQTPHILDVNGIRFAVAGATFSFNGIPAPRESGLVLPLLEEEGRLRDMVALARRAADVVIVSLHWGVENSQIITDAQRTLARRLAALGVDIILGTHPHVLQGMEWIDKPDGGKTFVAYSLGNFISAQNSPPQLVSGILDLTITREQPGGAITLSAPRFFPVITQYGGGYSNLHLVPWEKFTPALARAHGVRQRDGRFSYDYCKALLQKTIPEGILDLSATNG